MDPVVVNGNAAMSHLMETYGLGVALSFGVFTMFFFLMKWVLKTSEKQLEQMSHERKLWQEAACGFIEQLKSLSTQMQTNMLTTKSFFDAVTEAHRFQREEHKEMITCLGRINGYKEDH